MFWQVIWIHKKYTVTTINVSKCGNTFCSFHCWLLFVDYSKTNFCDLCEISTFSHGWRVPKRTWLGPNFGPLVLCVEQLVKLLFYSPLYLLTKFSLPIYKFNAFSCLKKKYYCIHIFIYSIILYMYNSCFVHLCFCLINYDY